MDESLKLCLSDQSEPHHFFIIHFKLFALIGLQAPWGTEMQLCITWAWTYSTKYGASTDTTTNNQIPMCQCTQTNSVSNRQNILE